MQIIRLSNRVRCNDATDECGVQTSSMQSLQRHCSQCNKEDRSQDEKVGETDISLIFDFYYNHN